MTRPSAVALEIAERTQDAYSADRYNSWSQVAQKLLNMGYDSRQTEAIMRSKYTRWAADYSEQPYGKVAASYLQVLRSKSPSLFTPKAIADLVEGTF